MTRLSTTFARAAVFSVVSAAWAFGGRVLPVEAIEAAETLRAPEFHAAFPGVRASPEVLGVPGFFVVYEHGNLRYFFGPLKNFGEARVWEDRLLEIRDDVIRQRSALEASRVYIYRFNYEESRRWSERYEPVDAAPPARPSLPGEGPPRVGEGGAAPGEVDAGEPEPGRPAQTGGEQTADAEEEDEDQELSGNAAATGSPAPDAGDSRFWRFIRRVFGLS